MEGIEGIIVRAREYLPALDADRIKRAYDFAYSAHAGQKRFSGDPYIVHPVAVTEILLDYHPDEDTIIAALLHDVAEDTPQTLADIERAFGSKVESLCNGMMKLAKVRSQEDDPQIENLRKLFLAMAKDYRVILIKLCDRLHNMQTLSFVRPEKQKRIAHETLNIFAPIASRLGIYRLKQQLEDLSFEFLHAKEFGDIQSQLEKTGEWREKYIDTASHILMDILSREGMGAVVDGRVKSPYSIYRKMARKNKNSVDEIFDVFALRITLPDIIKHGKPYFGHLYTALGILHNHFTPLTNRFKDYIAVPKVNGYRSLHTTVMGLGPKTYTQPTEVQIRSELMNLESEFGIAAHWVYEEKGVMPSTDKYMSRLMVPDMDDTEREHPSTTDDKVATRLKQHRDWISNLGQLGTQIKSNAELFQSLTADIFQDRILVLTPRGEVKDLPKGATPIDFAYAVHTEIGNHTMGARANGNIVPLDYRLKNGEVVEVVTRKNAEPKRHWLSFVVTNHAKNRIRGHFRGMDEEMYLREGRALLNEKLKQIGKPQLDVNLQALRVYNNRKLTVRERRELLRELGIGSLLPSTVIRKMFTQRELLATAKQEQIKLPAPAPSALRTEAPDSEKRLIIAGQTDIPYHFTKCCSATLADELIGYITRGYGVSVHRKICPAIRKLRRERFVPVRPPGEETEPIKIRIESDDRIGLIRDISQIFAEHFINILHLENIQGKMGNALLDYTVDINDFGQLEEILTHLENIPSVRRAYKVN